MPTSRRTLAIVATVSLVALGGAAAITAVALTGQSATPPGRGTVIVASELSQATDAASRAAAGTPEQAAAEYLSAQPTAFWLTPEAVPPGDVAKTIEQLASEARAQSARVAVVVYGLPGRDCGGHSAGGLDEEAYAAWTREIGVALRAAADVSPIVVLEPDSLALAPECGNVEERIRQLRDAAGALRSDDTSIYVDAGHSQWLPVAEMAGLVSRVAAGGGIRGFATNVSNYNATGDEIAYAHELAGRLDGMHALIDTSRNGAGSDGEWCNPAGALVGEPGGEIGDDVVDTNLWIKPPGESDGECHGGPPAGTWWPDGAVELTREVRAR